MTAVDEPGAKGRLKRTRTGCLKCRVRRRKCDEKKPRCQRCADSGFACQYGTKLSFLDKNAITAAAPSRTPRQGYTTLRFVDTHPSRSHSPPVLSPVRTSPGPSVSTVEVPQPGSQANPHGDRSRSDTPRLFTPQPPTLRLEQTQPVPDPVTCHADTSPNTGAYETALNVLASLGSGTGLPSPQHSRHNTRPHEACTPYFPSSDHVSTPASEIREEFSTCAILPQDRLVQLLRHYRYSVAPWLDIGDPSQTFGLDISRRALLSPPLLESLLALSSTSLDRHAEFDPKTITNTTHEVSEMTVIESLLVIAFAGVRQLSMSSPTEWQSPLAGVGLGSLDATLSHGDCFPVGTAIARLFLRLDISVGLLNSWAVSIPSVLLYSASSPGGASPDTTAEALKYDLNPLVLCAQALNYCFGNEVAQPGGLGTTQRWKVLSEALVLWYNNRPSELKPMFELGHNDQLFPLILFSSGTAILANQMFHTAMLLLLQNRPRTLLGGGRGRSVTMSPLWHAQRICGISLSNESRSTWDFSLVGSLYLGARGMTYEPQQRTILSGIERIAGVTGWDLEPLRMKLIGEWQPEWT